jgi:hypothetical protein
MRRGRKWIINISGAKLAPVNSHIPYHMFRRNGVAVDLKLLKRIRSGNARLSRGAGRGDLPDPCLSLTGRIFRLWKGVKRGLMSQPR